MDDVLIVGMIDGPQFFLPADRFEVVHALWLAADDEPVRERTLGGGQVAFACTEIAWMHLSTPEDRAMENRFASPDKDEPWRG